MNESSPVNLTKNSSNQLKNTCLSLCERFAQSIESACGWEFEFEAGFGGVLNLLAGGGGSPGVGGLEGEGDTDDEREGTSGRMLRATRGGGPFESGGDLLVGGGTKFVGREGGGGGGGGFDDFASGKSRFLEGWLCAGYPMSDRRVSPETSSLEEVGRVRSPGTDPWYC